MMRTSNASAWWATSCFVSLLFFFATATLAEPVQQILDSQDDLPSSKEHRGPRQPNIIFILTDDQDLHMSSLDYMPHLQQYLVKEGTTFSHHYCTVALCCPSRVSLWTGKHAHNTNVTDVNPPHGGYPKFVSQGFNEAYLPLWLQNAGYDTYYVGKLFNAHSTTSYNKPYPKGWNGSDFLLDPYTYEYLNATMQRNIEKWNRPLVHEEPSSYEGRYVTDVIADKALDFLDGAIVERYHKDGSGRPFFLTIAPTAPHSNVHINHDLSGGHGGKYTETTAVQTPPIPAERHKHLFADVTVPRTPDFNPDEPNTASWLKDLPQQNQTNIDFNDHFYRQRLRALQAVDEIIPRIILKLEFAGILQETYIVYSTDNGYHIGQHRLQPGKQCAYETDINVPMVVRGPEVLRGRIENKVSSHVDLAATFLSLAGIDPSISVPRYGLDGQSMVFHYFRGLETGSDKKTSLNHEHGPLVLPPTYQARDLNQSAEHVNVEMWGIIMPEGRYGTVLYPNHTYKALRVISTDDMYNLLYVVWCTNEHELYDLRADPYALKNLLSSEIIPDSLLNFSTSQQERHFTLDNVVARLDALLLVLKTCKEAQCTHPWNVLHSDGAVGNLLEALSDKHDELYTSQLPRVVFEHCEEAYIPQAEGVTWQGLEMWPTMT
ncbi:hypothetical protein LTR64_007660 [Lithohypha guttulata]|uniref:uncharacterized protein n=1 Tax=Lithohypha guttulata TaxID=1690604 RepID=UPI002DE0F529|nr:hypothetical protein LTR51_007169 [Lithohypha guttulata]